MEKGKKDEPLQANNWTEGCGGEPGGPHSSFSKHAGLDAASCKHSCTRRA